MNKLPNVTLLYGKSLARSVDEKSYKRSPAHTAQKQSACSFSC